MGGASTSVYEFNSIVRGQHVYKNIWTSLTTELHKLFSAQQIQTMWSMKGSYSPFLIIKKWIGSALCSNEYLCLTQPIAHFTCMQILAMVLVRFTSNIDNWLFPLVSEGICSAACTVPTKLAISNPNLPTLRHLAISSKF